MSNIPQNGTFTNPCASPVFSSCFPWNSPVDWLNQITMPRTAWWPPLLVESVWCTTLHSVRAPLASLGIPTLSIAALEPGESAIFFNINITSIINMNQEPISEIIQKAIFNHVYCLIVEIHVILDGLLLMWPAAETGPWMIDVTIPEGFFHHCRDGEAMEAR